MSEEKKLEDLTPSEALEALVNAATTFVPQGQHAGQYVNGMYKLAEKVKGELKDG